MLVPHTKSVLEEPAMTTSHLDIFKKDARGSPIWLDAVADLETARRRLEELVATRPGEYFAFDRITRKVIRMELDQIECT